MKKILIFGAGHRVKDNIFPALSSIEYDLDIDFVSLSGKELVSSGYQRKCFKFGLSEIDYSIYDLILISVPQNEVLKVVSSINKNERYKILLDTPITREINKFTKKYDIKVMEDIIFLPFIKIIKDYAPINQIIMMYSGYEYHGLAFVKNLIDKKILHAKRTRNSERDDVLIKFKTNKSAKIFNPRDYKKGYIEITYENKKKIVFGNKSTYIEIEGISDFIDGENYVVENIDLVKAHQDIKENLIVSTNYVNDIHIFKTFGLSNIFEKALEGKFSELPNVINCYEDYKVVNSITIRNRVKWKLKKLSQ